MKVSETMEDPIGFAVERGSLSELCHVLEESEWDIRSETLNSKGQSALHIACASGHLHIVRYLISEQKCSVTVKDVHGYTPLLLSLMKKRWKIADFLLQKTPKSIVNEQLYGTPTYVKLILTKIFNFALHEAHKKGYLSLLTLINETIKSHYEIYRTNEAITDEQSIKEAQSCGALHHVQYMLKELKCKTPANVPDIYVACITGNMERVKVDLDSKGQSILGTTECYGMAAIHYAAYEPNILSMIAGRVGNNGKLFNLSDKRGNTVLHHCVFSGCVDSVEHVIEIPECNLNYSNDEGDAPLHVACKRKNTAAVELLGEDERCDLNIYDKKGDTALHIAIQMGKSKMLQVLVENGADVLRPDRHGNAPIHIACLNFRLNILRILLSCKGCNPNQQNEDGDTALHIVCRMRIDDDFEYLKLLLSVLVQDIGGPECSVNHEGDVPLHVECKPGNTAAVQLLDVVIRKEILLCI